MLHRPRNLHVHNPRFHAHVRSVFYYPSPLKTRHPTRQPINPYPNLFSRFSVRNTNRQHLTLQLTPNQPKHKAKITLLWYLNILWNFVVLCVWYGYI